MSTNSNGRTRNFKLFVGSLAWGIKLGRAAADLRHAAPAASSSSPKRSFSQ